METRDDATDLELALKRLLTQASAVSAAQVGLKYYSAAVARIGEGPAIKLSVSSYSAHSLEK
jgi:hypothetical protein